MTAYLFWGISNEKVWFNCVEGYRKLKDPVCRDGEASFGIHGLSLKNYRGGSSLSRDFFFFSSVFLYFFTSFLFFIFYTTILTQRGCGPRVANYEQSSKLWCRATLCKSYSKGQLEKAIRISTWFYCELWTQSNSPISIL